jgi:hypothetical protein
MKNSKFKIKNANSEARSACRPWRTHQDWVAWASRPTAQAGGLFHPLAFLISNF